MADNESSKERMIDDQKSLTLNHLKSSIHKLINEYEQSHALLNDQIQAVVNHDILSLNRLIEKQIVIYETLKNSENKFKKQLQAFQRSTDPSSSKTLQEILDDIEEPSQTLNTLRNRLHTQVEKTEKLRTQLVDLLDFAQQQNNDIFEAICEIDGAKTDGYDEGGDEKQYQFNSIAINKKV